MFIFSDDKGQLIKKESYKKDIPDGTFLENYSTGKIKHQTIYKDGVIINEIKIDDYGVQVYKFDLAEEKAKAKSEKQKAKSKEDGEDDDIQDVIDEKNKKKKKKKN